MAKFYHITRRTRQFVWVRWDAYGPQRRGLSIRITAENFRRDWLPAAKRDGLDTQLYFKRSQSQMNTINITIYWNPRDKATAQDDLRAIVEAIENVSNTEPATIKNELGLIRAECASLETVEGHGQ